MPLIEKQAWRFLTSDEKLRSFRRWLKDRVDKGLFSTTVKGQPWTAQYIESAYKKGLVDAYVKQNRRTLKRRAPLGLGTQEQFLRAAFAQPERTSKAKLLATRSFEELEDITSTMSNKIGKVLADGIIRGDNPRKIARVMAQEVRSISRSRALRIARTEIIYAHAEGTLDGFEELGVDEVGVEAEWSTAGDDKVCPLCEALEGKVFSVQEARGLLPRHPNCRCAWIPSARLSKPGEAQKAAKASIAQERVGKRTFAQTIARSSWLGKEILP